MDAAEFIQKRRDTPLSEQAAAQQHFLELCKLLGVRVERERRPGLLGGMTGWTGENFASASGEAAWVCAGCWDNRHASGMDPGR